MTTTTRQLIDEMTFSYDLDGLGDMLIEFEADDDTMACLYEAIDKVSEGLALTINPDAICTIA